MDGTVETLLDDQMSDRPTQGTVTLNDVGPYQRGGSAGYIGYHPYLQGPITSTFNSGTSTLKYVWT